ncbi:purine and uridine phosphorylase [Polychaeton citri CBS 116435]|uniref:Purine and uridine phosphorylase n=1 Tax=Polychaeton citri CBS 116435 TaxID=1314669 RepID=A0A9P4Q7M6_9PEZI|nr:purine and uridine phosphorylase [Polychaeton citri CBS 116435]
MARSLNSDYTVAWICALPVPEWKASWLLFDETHDDVQLSSTSSYQYVYGNMDGHNIVLGCLSDTQKGTTAAAAVVLEMKSNFLSLRFGLMVGVGGSVPSSSKDTRLGDVVVSRPDTTAADGGVIQSQMIEDLISALGKVQAMPHHESQFAAYLTSRDFSRELGFAKRPKRDRVFNASYIHVEGHSTCDQCNTEEEVQRLVREREGPVIHYETIASSNQVMKGANARDRIIRDRSNVLCFDMGAAGLMNRSPCLIIRGICNYSDSHKNME